MAEPVTESARIVNLGLAIYDRSISVIWWMGETCDLFHAIFINGDVLNKY